jgi:hypothetical protein
LVRPRASFRPGLHVPEAVVSSGCQRTAGRLTVKLAATFPGRFGRRCRSVLRCLTSMVRVFKRIANHFPVLPLLLGGRDWLPWAPVL